MIRLGRVRPYWGIGVKAPEVADPITGLAAPGSELYCLSAPAVCALSRKILLYYYVWQAVLQPSEELPAVGS